MNHERFFTLLGKEFSDGACYGLELMLRYHNDKVIELPPSVVKEITEQIETAKIVSDKLHEERLQEIRNKML